MMYFLVPVLTALGAFFLLDLCTLAWVLTDLFCGAAVLLACAALLWRKPSSVCQRIVVGVFLCLSLLIIGANHGFFEFLLR
jgi:hypothetical protein